MGSVEITHCTSCGGEMEAQCGSCMQSLRAAEPPSLPVDREVLERLMDYACLARAESSPVVVDCRITEGGTVETPMESREICGAPGRTRTLNPQIRRPVSGSENATGQTDAPFPHRGAYAELAEARRNWGRVERALPLLGRRAWVVRGAL